MYAFRDLPAKTKREDFITMFERNLKDQKEFEDRTKNETSIKNIADTQIYHEIADLAKELPHQLAVINKIKQMRNPDGNKDISGDKLEKIERFIEAGNISHLSMEEVIFLFIK